MGKKGTVLKKRLVQFNDVRAQAFLANFGSSGLSSGRCTHSWYTQSSGLSLEVF